MAQTVQVSLQFTANTEQARHQLQNLQQTLNNLGQGANVNEIGNRITTDILKAQQAATGLSTALKNATNVNTGQLNLTKFSTELSKQKMSLADYRQQLQLLGTTGQQAFIQLTQSIRQAEVGFRNTNKFISSMWVNLKNVAKWQISSAVLTSFTSTFSDAFRYAQDLNESLNNIRIVSGQSTEQMAQFAKEANKAAKALSTTTTEYTDAALIFYQQGLNDEQVKERTDITIKMANASSQSAEIVSDQLTAVWNNFDNGTKSLESYADAMVALGAETASSSEEIATGLEKFAAIAETTGLSFEYASAALATVTATTRQSADIVGTAFKTLFARIQDLEVGKTLEDGTTLGKYSEALNAVGVNIKDANGGLKDMDIILNELAGVWGNLDRDQKAALAQTVAGTRQYTQLMALMENWDFMERNLQTIQDSTGALQEQADIYAESWAAASDRVKASAEGIYDSLIKDDFIIDLTDGFAGFLGLLEKVIDTMGGFKGVLSAVYLIFSKIFNQQMQKGIANMAQSLYSWTNAAERSAQALRKEAYQEAMIAVVSGPTGNSEANQYRAQSLREELSLKEKILNIDKTLTEEQKLQISQSIELISNAKEQVAQQIAKKEALQEELKLSQQELSSLRGQKGGLTKGLNARIRERDQYISELATYGLDTTQLQMQRGEDNTRFRRRMRRSVHEGGMGLTAAEADTLLNRLNAVQQVEKQIDQINKQIAETLKKQGKTEEEINKILEDVEASTKNIHDFENDIIQTANKKSSFEKLSASIMGTMSSISSLTMGISSLTSAWNTLKDPDISGWEKFTSVMMSLSIGLPMVINGITSLNSALGISQLVTNQLTITQGKKIGIDITQAGVQKALANALNATNKETQLDLLMTDLQISEETALLLLENEELLTKLLKIPVQEKETKNTVKQTVAEIGLNTVKKIGLFLQKALNSEFLITIAVVAIVVAAIAALVIGIKALVNWWNKDKIAAEEANKSLNEQKKILNETKQAYDDLKSSIENYQSAQKAIDSMKSGTEEWKNKIQEANEIVIDLLNRYPQLAKYIDDTNGRLTISKAGIEEVKKFEKQRVETQRQQVNAAQIRANEAQRRADRTNFIRTKGDYYTASDWAGNIGLQTGVQGMTGMVAGAVAGAGIGAIPGAVVGAISGAVGGTIQSAIENATAGASMEYALDRFSKAYEQQGESLFLHYEEKVKEIAGSNQALADELIKEKDAVQELIRTEKALDKTNQLLTEQITRSALGEDATDAEVALAASPEYQAAAEREAKEKVNSLVDKEQEYLEKVIGDTKNARIKDGKLERYIDGSWQEQGNVSSEDIENRLIDYYKTQYFEDDKKRKELENRVSSDRASMRAEGINFTEEQMGDFYRGDISIANFDTEDEFNKFISWLKSNSDLQKRQLSLEEYLQQRRKETNQYNPQANIAFTNEYNKLKEENSDKIYTGGIDMSQFKDKNWEEFQQQQFTSLTGYEGLNKKQKDEFLAFFNDLTQSEKKMFLEKADFEVAKNQEAWDKILKDAKAAEQATKKMEFFEGLKNSEEDLNGLSKAVKELEEESNISATTVAGLKEKFSQYTNEWENLIRVAGTGDVEAQQKALDELAGAYLEQSGLLDKVGASYRNVAIEELKSLGFKNAENIVNNKIKQQLYELVSVEKEQAIVNGELNDSYFDNLEVLGYTKQEITELKTALNMTAEEFNNYAQNAVNSGQLSKQSATELYKLKIGMLNLDSVASAADFSKYLTGLANIGAVSKQSLRYIQALATVMEQVEWDEKTKTYKFKDTTKARRIDKTADELVKQAMDKAEENLEYEPDIIGPYTGNEEDKKDKSGQDKSKIDVSNIDELNAEIDRLEDENDALERINRLIEEQNKIIEKSTGTKKLNAIKKKQELLADKDAELSKKETDAKTERNTVAKLAKDYGIDVEYDENGEILNPEAVREQINREIIRLQEEFNALPDEQRTDEEKESYERTIDKLKNFVDDYKEYTEELISIGEEKNAIIAEQQAALMEEIIEKFEPIREKAQRELDLIDFRVDINEDDLNGIVEDYALLTEKTGLFGTQMQSINDQLHETALRWDELDPEERASQIESLGSSAQEVAQSAKELRESWVASYGEVLDKGLEKISRTTDQFENLNSALEHYKSLMDLLGRSQNYKQIDKILQGQSTVLKDQMTSSKSTYDMLRGQMDYWKMQLANAATESEKEAIQTQIDAITPELASAYEEWLSLGEEYAQNLQDILTNSLTEAAKDLEDALTGDLGFDLLQSKIEALQAEDEVYLTETNQAYETNKLIRQAQIDIDKSTNKLHQEMLKKFQQETKVLQDQKQLSKDELEIQQLKYNLLVAQIALEDARDAKNQVRLMRDSQGNFNYVYTADQNAISEAEQAYADADNELYNKYLEVTNSNASLIQQIQQEFAQEAAGLDPTDPDYLDKLADLQKRALDKIKMYYEQYSIGIEGLGDRASEAWTQNIMKNIDSVRQFRQDSEQYIDEVTDAYNEHADKIEDLTTELDLNYRGTADKIGEIATKSNELKNTVIANKPLVEDALTKQANALVNWMKENDSVIDGLIQRALKYSSLVNALQNTDGGYHAIMKQAADKRDRELFEMAANLRRMKVDATGNDYGRSTDDIYNELKWFNTGGYTGSWNGDSGKLAVLHEKELVLNKTDTENILSAVDIVRKVLDAVSLQNIASRYSLSNISQSALGAATTKIDQQVQITAEFPNATDKNEIKAAFDDIINEAVQYAGIRRV